MSGFEYTLKKVLIIPLTKVRFDIRATYKCRTCSHYGWCHTCPPKIPDIEYWKKLVYSYNLATLVVLLADYHQGNFDKIRVESARTLHKIMLDMEKECFQQNKYWAAALVGGSCRVCAAGCKEICQFPDKARVAMEGAGIDVITTCKNAGIHLPEYPHPKGDSGQLARVGLLLVE